MKIIGIDHVQIAMPEGQERAARDFYEGVLGLTEVPKPENLAMRGGCWFELGPVKVHLGVTKVFRPAKKTHPAFLVSDLSETIEKLAKSGVSCRDDEPLQGFLRTYVFDPFGNRIELMQRLADSQIPFGP